jgi:biotin synthase
MSELRHDWTLEEVLDIYNRPLLSLVYDAATVHRQYHETGEVQISTLLSIKTGGCPEDCAYCPQAARYHTEIDKNDLMTVNQVKAAALRARQSGASRLCMGAAWRNVEDGAEFDQVIDMVRTVYDQGLEVCCTLGMLTEHQAQRLADAGLYAYNHNVDTGEEYYKEIISTRGYDDRLKTLENVRKAQLTVCSGGIIGMGEKPDDRCSMLVTLSRLAPHPESVPINALVAVEGTPLEEQRPTPIWDMVRMIATARIVLPSTTIRLSAGRTQMTDEGQALCFLAGAGSIFAGDKLLTTPNPDINRDLQLFETLGLSPRKAYKKGDKPMVNDSNRPATGERGQWSRPGHTIARNVEATEKGKAARREMKAATQG